VRKRRIFVVLLLHDFHVDCTYPIPNRTYFEGVFDASIPTDSDLCLLIEILSQSLLKSQQNLTKKC